MGKNLENIFRELKDDVSTYAELKLELLKLNTYERISNVFAIFSYGLLLMTVVIITFLFIMISLGFLFSMWLKSTTAGFGIIAFLYLILVVIIVLNKQRICLKVINVILLTLNSIDKRNAVTNTETATSQPKQTADAT